MKITYRGNEHNRTLEQEQKLGDSQYVVWFDELRMTDVSRVGGKNASLGEMISQLTKAGERAPSRFNRTRIRQFVYYRQASDIQLPWLSLVDTQVGLSFQEPGKPACSGLQGARQHQYAIGAGNS
jgi:hypothetical protein